MAQKDNQYFYQKSIKKYGISAKGVHWNSQYSQYIRFEILSSFIKDKITTSSIIDAGCGFGEFYNYLFDNNLKPESYIGVDCEIDMIELASKRFLNTEFYLQNIIEDKLFIADFYICSGAMNILEKKELFIFIKKCFEISNYGFIFNILKNDSFNKVSLTQVLEYCKTLSTQIEIKDNYLDNDISIYIKK